MNAVPVVGPADLPGARSRARPRTRVWVRATSFALLCLYGVLRWGTLMRDPPGWRLLGLVGLAVGLAVLVPLVRHLTAAWPAHGGRIVSGLLAAVLGLATLPVAGLRWQWVIHLRVAQSADAIGSGLGSLGDVLVPYLGRGYPIRLVMTLGAAVLLVDAAAALAFAPRQMSDGRRAAAALPHIALAVVPATLVAPRYPSLQGLLLFFLLAAFLWGERIPSDTAAAALGVACAAGLAATIAGPLVAPRQAWVDYRDWAGSSTATLAESFDWNQTYGPLRWPQDGRVVLSVHARRADYWTAEDLTGFNGTDWVQEPLAGVAPLPAVPAAIRRRYTQPISVTVQEMHTTDVIGASSTVGRPDVPGGASVGATSGTWVADDELGPGDGYTALDYSPHPSASALSRPGPYPWSALAPDLTLDLPVDRGAHPRLIQTVFTDGFHRPLPAALRAELARSPYGSALALARRLAAGAATPYAFVDAVRAYLDSGRYAYSQATSATQYPLLTFLFETGTGYCQQFSGAMAMLLRMGGVPARVAAGFTPGSPDRSGHTFTVTDIDAHAWVQVWFPRYGWVRFDPTPSTAPARGGTGGQSSIAALNGLRNSERRLTTHPRAAAPVHPAGTIGQSDGKVPARGRPARGHGGAPVWPWVGLGALLAAGLLAAAGWTLRRAARRADPIAELTRALASLGQPAGGGTTLAGLERRFGSHPQAAAYIRQLSAARYGGAPGAGPPSVTGRRELRAALGAGRGLRGRLRALWALPPRPARRPRPPRPPRAAA